VVRVNEEHARVCASPEWAEFVQTELLPGFLGDVPLGADMLELGPGPGATTEWLRHRVERLTAVELEDAAAEKLRTRFAGTNVTVATGDATALTYPDASFDTVGAFTMLHHIPTAAGQNRLLAEALRVLRPGGVLVGSDSLPSERLHHFHADDVYNPIEPGTLVTRLQTLGFAQVTVIVDERLKFTARKNVLAPGEGDHLTSSQRADGAE
jgi:SAM-dependent methyltransferase